MTNIQRKKQNDNKNTMGSVVAGVAGAVAIASVAVAATMALKDEKTRKKTKKVFIDVKDQAINYIDALKKEPSGNKKTYAIKKIAKNTKKVVIKNTTKGVKK